MDHYRNIGIASEIIAAVMATIYYKKYIHTNLKYLLLLLWFIIINEILSQFVFPRTSTGYLLRNLYRITVTMTLLLTIYKELYSKGKKQTVLYLIIMSSIGFIVNMFFANPLNSFLSISFTIASIFIVIGLLCYLIEFLQMDKKINVSKDLFLWISFGFLIFFLAYPVIFFSRSLLSQGNNYLLSSLNKIQFIIAILSYLIIAFGFYWGEKRS